MKDQEIPGDFYSFETNTPFERCIECEKYLLHEDTEYIIEKAIKNYEGYPARDVVFDYAICMDCAEKMRREVSKESWQKMMQYFQENMDVQHRIEMQQQSAEENLQSCMIKKTNVNECREYQIYAHCKGNKLNMENPPYMISGEVMEELIPLLSDKTIDEMNGFLDKHFSPDPSLMEPAPPRLILV
ncbi:hypothetical protein SAMN05421640_0247 [Ekhidna lutea]|uniref:Uncharacterized protein n=1 Tax=Ekhidna lutea TaxID=447679 RepID=A0A239EP68_EKHLU|nr:hypothetical protein [Ekhidna lutea]SNS46201.1 hypothetical protein SAMN05421640_0247 [Ekhidna lutea]